jgi:Icc-related predicted phosphoesterase
MKIVALSDIHGDLGMAERLGGHIEGIGPDLILISGDLTNFGTVRGAEEILKLLHRGVRIFFVPGNCDPRSLLEVDSLGDAYNLHGRIINFSGIDLLGLGGSTPTPFNTPNELSEGEIRAILSRLEPSSPGSILLSHAPPHDTLLDKASLGHHVGSRVLREFIEGVKPKLAVVGHIHEARGTQRLDSTLILNPGPLSRGYYSIIEMGIQGVEAELLRL